MKNKNLLIGAGVVVLGILAYNYFSKRNKVAAPKVKEDAIVASEEVVELKPLKGGKI
jgi:hypothetical protein